MKIHSLFLAALLLIAFKAQAQFGSLPERNFGARGLALGQSALAASHDALATAWNPASASHMQRFAVTYSRLGLQNSNTMQSFGAILPLRERGALGVSYFRWQTARIMLTDEEGNRIGEATFAQEHLLLTYGRNLSRVLAVGANAKFVRQTFTPNYESGPENVGIDFGMLYRMPETNLFTRDLIIGMAIDNLVQPTLKLFANRESLPREWRMILEKSVTSRGHRLTFVTNLGRHEKLGRAGNETRTHFGVEYAHRGLPNLRAGIHDGAMALGFGVRWRVLLLDYALVSSSEYEGSFSRHAWSLTLQL